MSRHCAERSDKAIRPLDELRDYVRLMASSSLSLRADGLSTVEGQSRQTHGGQASYSRRCRFVVVVPLVSFRREGMGSGRSLRPAGWAPVPDAEVLYRPSSR